MRNFRAFLLIGLSLSLMACGEKKHNVALERANVREVVGDNIVPTGPSDQPIQNSALTGRVYATLNSSAYNSDPTWQDDFMDGVQGFVSATDNPAAYGYVNGSPTSTSSTGIYFGGSLVWSGNQILTENSYIALEIRDHYTGTKAPNGQVIPAYPVRMPMQNYYYDESKSYELEVIFGDSYGRMVLKGNFIDGYVQGYIQYQNSTKFDGSAPESGILGSFKIPTCDFFQGLEGCR